MFDCLQGNGHARHRPDLLGPHPSAVDDVLGLDRAVLGDDPGDPAALLRDSSDRGVLDDADTAHPGPLGQRHRHICRIGPSFIGGVETSDHSAGVDLWPQVGDFGGGDLLALDAHHPQEVRLATELVGPLIRAGGLEVADRPKAGGEPGLVLEHLVEVSRVLGHPGEGFCGHASGDNKACGMPCGPGGELVTLQQDNVVPAELGQVVRNAATDHPATDDHHSCPVGNRRCARSGVRHQALASCSESPNASRVRATSSAECAADRKNGSRASLTAKMPRRIIPMITSPYRSSSWLT